VFKLSEKNNGCVEIQPFEFRTEGSEFLSPQVLLQKYPEILLSIDEIDISPYEQIISVREYSTSRGSIDIVYITDNADIVLVETKLLKNPESHRTVVAQAIDYAKAFSEEKLDDLKNKFNRKGANLNIFSDKEYYESVLEQNIKNGNYQVLIVGDKVHPNILGMIESIQSAPHLAFTLYGVSLNPFILENNALIIDARVETKTNEVERSVISIEILDNREIKVDSATPEKKRKGNKPKISEEIYLNNLEDDSYIEKIRNLWHEIEKRNGTIEWGSVGFSAGYYIGKRRISLIWIYDSSFNILTKRMKTSYEIISDENYNSYIETLKESPYIYTNIVVANKSEVSFKQIEHKDFDIAMRAALDLFDKLKKEEE